MWTDTRLEIGAVARPGVRLPNSPPFIKSNQGMCTVVDRSKFGLRAYR